ncbi:MAG: 2-hydroxyacyl-CoA dehydratase [Actinobacteria bacterium]|nr:2-hydroxyacyl-CoA dehydratase [Actinomycetota bacterium]
MGDVKSVAWFCAYTPLEILDAAGLAPVRRFGDPASLEAADAVLHQAICPYVRACLAAAMDGSAPTPGDNHHHAVFVNSCDGMRRLHDAWQARFPKDFVFLMDLPRNEDSAGERLLAGEFVRLAEALEAFTGSAIGAHALLEAARGREERRLAYLESSRGLSGAGRLRLAMAFQSSPATEKPVPGTGVARAGGVPVLLTGNLLNPEGLVSVLEEAGAAVVRVDLCNGDRAFSSPILATGDGLEEVCLSLARGYLDRRPCARMTDARRRLDLLVEEVRETGARGIIYAGLKFCDSYLYDFPRVQRRLREEGVPLLRLESDYADGHVGQLLTRVEAFLEMI